MIKIILFFALFINLLSFSATDICIFSFDRPMALESLCRSIKKNIKSGLGNVHIIYRTTQPMYQQGYDIVKNLYPEFIFHKQTHAPSDFKPLIMDNLFSDCSNFIMFAVDDDIVRSEIDLVQCMNALEQTGAYAFFLRLGLNVDFCFMRKFHSGVPTNIKVSECINIYQFKDGSGDWQYPNNVDMTIYRKKDIKSTLQKIKMVHPWSLEGEWYNFSDMNLYGLFFDESKIVNLSVNLTGNNKNYSQFDQKWLKSKMKIWSTKNMCKMFLEGKRIDINEFEYMKINSTHICVEPKLIS